MSLLQPEQARLHHDVVWRDGGDAEALEQVGGQGQGGERDRRRPPPCPHVRVHVAAGERHVPLRERVEVRALRQYPAKLDVVLLARSLLAGLDRVAVEHPGAPGAVQAPLYLREVQELAAAVAEHHREDVRERALAIGLHGVEGRLDVGLRLGREQDVELEEQPHEVERQYALRVAPQALHAVDLNGEQAQVVRQRQPIGVGAALQAHLGAARLALPARRVPHLPRQLDVGQPHDAPVHVVVEGAHGHGELVPVDGPYGLEALPLAEQLLDLVNHHAQLVRLAGDTDMREPEPLVVLRLRFRGHVAGLFPNAVGALAAPAAYERGALPPLACLLVEFPADVVAALELAALARRGGRPALAAQHHDPAARVPGAPGLGRRRRLPRREQRPVRPHLVGDGRGRHADPRGYLPERLALLEHLLDLAAVVKRELLALLLRHGNHLLSGPRGE